MQRGVFYTPRPVVSYIVRSVDELLHTEFGLEDGLADTTTWVEMAKRHMDLKIPEGKHVIELRRPASLPWRKEISLTRGERLSLSAELQDKYKSALTFSIQK